MPCFAAQKELDAAMFGGDPTNHLAASTSEGPDTEPANAEDRDPERVGKAKIVHDVAKAKQERMGNGPFQKLEKEVSNARRAIEIEIEETTKIFLKMTPLAKAAVLALAPARARAAMLLDMCAEDVALTLAAMTPADSALTFDLLVEYHGGSLSNTDHAGLYDTAAAWVLMELLLCWWH